MLNTYLAPLAAPALPHRPFLSGEAKMDYGTLAKTCGQTRALFDAHCDGHDHRIAIISADRSAVTTLYLACLAHGLTAVMLDPQGSATELTMKLALVEPTLIFADKPVIDRCEAIQQTDGPTAITISQDRPGKTAFGLLLGRKKAQAPAETFPALVDQYTPVTALAEVAENAPALILFTSGTTSNPKGVVLDRGALATQMDVFIRRFGLNQDSKIVNHLPFHHSDGLNQGPLMALCAEGELIIETANDLNALGRMLDTIYTARATHLITVPTVLSMMDRLPDQYDDSLRHEEFAFIESTAGPLDAGLWQRVEARYGTRIVNCYGLTETVNEALYCGPDDDSHKIGSVGKVDGFDLRIIDADGIDVPAGEPGEMLLRGRGLMQGYYKNDAATAEALRDGWLHTGDLATLDADGFVQIVGRIKSLIVRAGINIIPSDLDRAALELPEVQMSQTIGIADEALGERVVTCVVGSGDLRQKLAEHLRATLADEMQPNEIMVMDDLPLGPSGKVDLPRLKALIETPADVGPTGSIAETVMEVAATAFRANAANLTAKDGPDQIPGWDSLAFLDFALRLERRFDIRIPPRDIMRMDSIGAAIAVIEAKTTPEAGAA